LKRGLPVCHGGEQLRKKIVKPGEAEGRELLLQVRREVMEDLTRSVNVSFESLMGPLPMPPMNSYYGDRRSSSEPGM
jgi:hypothetical protein